MGAKGVVTMKTLLLFIALLPFGNVVEYEHFGVLIRDPGAPVVNQELVEAVSFDEKGNALNDKQKIEKALSLLKQAFPDWTKRYEAKGWDCDTMSTFVRYYLGVVGMESRVMSGTAKNGTAHAWVECKGYTIEAISLEIKSTELYARVYSYDRHIYVPENIWGYDKRYPMQGWWTTRYMEEKFWIAYGKGLAKYRSHAEARALGLVK